MVFQDRVDDVPQEHQVHRQGQWLPTDHRIHRDWMNSIIEKVDANPKDYHPVIKEFKSLIENNTCIYLLVSSMFEEIPTKKPYSQDPAGHKQVRDYEHMLMLFNHILTTAPEWNDRSYGVGMVGTPMNAILDWPMGTPSGFAFFLDPDVNKMLKKLLNAWAEFLSSPASAYVLGNDCIGWFSEHGTQDLCATANVGKTSYAFEELFKCDPTAKHHGFKSWDDFFTRHLHEDKRPVASPEDDNVIANACESKPYNIARNIAARDRFWIKGQPYSLLDMLDHDPLHGHFVGGTIYQAFLSALSYHRWHAPVSGTVKKAYVKDGTYFSEPLFEGLGDPTTKSNDINKAGEADGQGYLTATATRAIIYFEADSKDIGLVCFLGIGMTEVSTCDITVKEAQHVKKGDEIGMFHYGGSTHCVIFRKGLELEAFPEIGGEENLPVRSRLAAIKGHS
ncbi:phosphatidylserine decarboxylase family protein [Paraphaeosphaeria sporulosa]